MYVCFCRVFKELQEKPKENKPPAEVPPPVETPAPEEKKEDESEKPDDESKAEDEIVIDVEKPVEPSELESLKPPPVEVKKTVLEELTSWLHGQLPLTKEQLENLCIQMGDFEKALKTVQPSAKREGFATVPDTTWDDIGSLRDIREELQMSILVRFNDTNMLYNTDRYILIFVGTCETFRSVQNVGFNDSYRTFAVWSPRMW